MGLYSIVADYSWEFHTPEQSCGAQLAKRERLHRKGPDLFRIQL